MLPTGILRFSWIALASMRIYGKVWYNLSKDLFYYRKGKVSELNNRMFLYLRVSTDDQEDNTSLEQQEIDGRTYCEQNGFTVAGVFKDVFTGAVWRERKEFMKMRERYLRGDVSGVVVRTYSRFTRIIADYLVLTQEMQENNIRLFCVNEQYDDSPMGHMLQAIQMGFNEQERLTTRQRTIDGKMARVTNKKQYLAGKKPPYGYRFNNEKTKDKLVIYEEEAVTVRIILRMRAQKKATYAITKYLIENHIPSPTGGNWNERTVRIIVERANDMYRGIAYAYKYQFTKEYRNGKRVTVKMVRPENERLLLPDGTVPRIIDDETAFLALAAAAINIQESSRNNTDPENSLLRSGFIKCGQCGLSMSVHNKKKVSGSYPYYRCNAISRADRQNHASMEIAIPKIDAMVWDYICEIIKDLEIIENVVNIALEVDMFSSPEKAAVKIIADYGALIEQYREDLKTTGLSKSARLVLLEDLSKQTDLLENLENELAAIRSGIISQEKVFNEYRAFVTWCHKFRKQGNEEATYQEKRDALRFLGVTVIIHKVDAPQGRYSIRLAPPDLMRSLKLIPQKNDIEGTLSRSGS